MIFHRSLALCALATLATLPLASAQEVAPPTTSTLDEVPTGPGAAAPVMNGPRLKAPTGTLPSTSTDPVSPEPQLMPDAAPGTGSLDKPERGPATSAEPSKTEKEKKIGTSKTEIFSRDVQNRIRLRQVQTQALADRAVVAEWDRAVAAKTFPEKRAALKQYYKLLYARMLKIDGSLEKLITAKATAADTRLTQKFVTADNVEQSDRSTSARVFAE